MCEIFSALGATILGASSLTSGLATSTAVTTAVGIGATASTVGGLASTGIGIANSVRASRESSNVQNMKNELARQSNRLNVEKTAEQLNENRLNSRTLASLRIPLNKTAESSVNTAQGNSTNSTGINIPM